jgi:hypothetical protein
MPGVIRTLPLAILKPAWVQPEHGLLGGRGVVTTGPSSCSQHPHTQTRPYLQPVAHLHKCTGWMEGPCATGQQVGVVIGMQQLHEVHTLSLVGSQGQGQ